MAIRQRNNTSSYPGFTLVQKECAFLKPAIQILFHQIRFYIAGDAAQKSTASTKERQNLSFY